MKVTRARIPEADGVSSTPIFMQPGTASQPPRSIDGVAQTPLVVVGREQGCSTIAADDPLHGLRISLAALPLDGWNTPAAYVKRRRLSARSSACA